MARTKTPTPSPFAAVADALAIVRVTAMAASYEEALYLLDVARKWPHYVEHTRGMQPSGEGWDVEILSRRPLSFAEMREWRSEAQTLRAKHEREAEQLRRDEAKAKAKREDEARKDLRRAEAAVAAAQAAAPSGPNAAYAYNLGEDTTDLVPIVARVGVLVARKKGSVYTFMHEPTGLALPPPWTPPPRVEREVVKTQARARELLERAARPEVMAALDAALASGAAPEKFAEFYAAWQAAPEVRWRSPTACASFAAAAAALGSVVTMVTMLPAVTMATRAVRGDEQRDGEDEAEAKRADEAWALLQRARAAVAAAQAAVPPGPTTAYVYKRVDDQERAELEPIVARAGDLYVRKADKGNAYRIVHGPTGMDFDAPDREVVKTKKRAVELLELAARPEVRTALEATLARGAGWAKVKDFYAAWRKAGEAAPATKRPERAAFAAAAALDEVRATAARATSASRTSRPFWLEGSTEPPPEPPPGVPALWRRSCADRERVMCSWCGATRRDPKLGEPANIKPPPPNPSGKEVQCPRCPVLRHRRAGRQRRMASASRDGSSFAAAAAALAV